MTRLFWDLETYSETSIKDGAHRYAEGAEVLLFAWAVDDGPVQCWDLTEDKPMPDTLADAMRKADEYWGHNSGMFDLVVVKHFDPSWFFCKDRHRDTMVQALCHGLPGKLDTLCEIFKLGADVAKSKRGKQLIQMFCKPQPANQKLRRKTRETHPAEWAEFIEYAKSDITSMRVLHQKMPKWNYPNHEFELKLWQMDQQINTAGIYVDLELSAKAIEATDLAQAKLATSVDEATDGAVGSATQRDKLLQHILAEYGVSLPDMRGDTLERRLTDPSLPDGVRDLIGMRLMASTSSVSKYKRVMRSVSSDGYLRGTVQFSGAGRTGRDAGRLFQPQNLMRPTLEAQEIDTGIDAIKAGCADLVTDNVMELCANAMRGVIIAPPEQKIVVADLSNIEGRVLAWDAGEEWKIKAFSDFDAGIGPDLYIASYARTFRVPLGQAKRQVGKVLELAMGFGGGVGSFLTFAAVYNLDLEKMTAGLSLPDDVVAEAENFWGWSKDTKRSTYGLSKEVFVACDALKRLWRRAHPKIEAMWKSDEVAFQSAVHNEGQEFKSGRSVFAREGNWLRVILPSGRSLSYPAPQAEDKLSFMGMNQYSRKWQRITTYGGKLTENRTQANARDVFKFCYPRVTEARYSIRLPIHDELLTYAPDSPEFNAKHLSSLMTVKAPWMHGLPLAAAGFEAYRYKKES
jgi:DNA polymerase bacteriophage-type